MKALKLTILALALFAAPAFGTSVSTTNIGDHWVLDFNGIVGLASVPTVMPGLEARVGFKVTDRYYDAWWDRTFVTMEITVVNTTDSAIWRNSTVSGIGFDTSPNVRRFGSSVSGDYDFLKFNSQLPTGAGFTVEVCISGGLSYCGGPAAGASTIGQTATATVTLAFYGNYTGGIIFDNFGVRYSDVFSSQLGVNGLMGMGVPVTPPIPEPASAAVFGIGALLVAAAIRRQRAK